MTKPAWAEATKASLRDKFLKVSQIEYERINPPENSAVQSFWAIKEGYRLRNSSRNRYSNVVPWEHTRVKLPVKANANDYINANYVDLAQDSKYIASQGPKEQAIHHFWAMAFAEAAKRKEENIIIVMITPLIENEMVKCCKYWPDEKASSISMTSSINKDGIDLESLSIKYETKADLQDYVLTQLSLTAGDVTKKVFHFHFKNWADSKVPLSGESLGKFSDDINSYKREYNVSVPIVHCSAGVGRTGTFIALDYLKTHPQLLTTLTPEDPIFEVFKALRYHRLMMIQTVYQYIFLYDYFRKVHGYE